MFLPARQRSFGASALDSLSIGLSKFSVNSTFTVVRRYAPDSPGYLRYVLGFSVSDLFMQIFCHVGVAGAGACQGSWLFAEVCNACNWDVEISHLHPSPKEDVRRSRVNFLHE